MDQTVALDISRYETTQICFCEASLEQWQGDSLDKLFEGNEYVSKEL